MKSISVILLLGTCILLGNVPKNTKLPVITNTTERAQSLTDATNFFSIDERIDALKEDSRGKANVENFLKTGENAILSEYGAECEAAMYNSATNLLAFDYKAGAHRLRLIIVNPSIAATNSGVLCGTFYILYPLEWEIVSFYYDFPHEGKVSGRSTSVVYECGPNRHCSWELPLEKPLTGVTLSNDLRTEKYLRELTLLPLDTIRFEPGECRPEWIPSFDIGDDRTSE